MTYFFCRECRLEFEDPVPGRERCKECCSHDIVEITGDLLDSERKGGRNRMGKRGNHGKVSENEEVFPRVPYFPTGSEGVSL